MSPLVSRLLTATDGGKIHSMVVPSSRSRWAAPLRSMALGLGFFFLGSLSDLWLQRHAASSSIALVDDALVGIGAGLLVLLYERRQRRNMIKRLEVIRLMNHHVRNSLQVISFAASAPQQQELADKVQEAVGRIEWALREVLPGQREDISDLLVPPPSDESPAQKPKVVA
jgi:4-amino-4-deoxy-L-arabinose transferase-like glycosyltransferase